MHYIVLAAGLAASALAGPAFAQSTQAVRIGVTPEPHARILGAGKPVADASLWEDPKNPYVHLIEMRAADKHKPRVKELVDAYRSPEDKAIIAETFKSAVIASW